MSTRMNHEGLARYKRKHLFPHVKEDAVTDTVLLEKNSYGLFKAKIVEFPVQITLISCRCPHCGFQMYGYWNKDDFKITTSLYGEWKPEYYFSKSAMTLQSLLNLGKKEKTNYAPISAKIETEIRRFKKMYECPLCGENLPEKKEYVWDTNGTIYSGGIDIERELSSMFNEYIKECADAPVKCIKETFPLKSTLRNNVALQKIEFNKELILNNKETLLKYIKTLLDTEMTVQMLEKRTDYTGAFHWTGRDAYSRVEEMMSEMADEQYNSLMVMKEAHQQALNKAKLEKLSEKPMLGLTPPVLPEFTAVCPTEPIYLKAGLFNAKKVTAKNEQMREEYETQLKFFEKQQQEYKQNLSDYEVAVSEYEQALENYNMAVAKWEEECQREQDAMIKRFNMEYKEQQKNVLEHVEKNREEFLANLPLYNAYIMRLDEHKQTLELLSKGYSCLKSLYDCDIIYEKYRNPIALSSFYDYLASGRCDTLTGHEGAYNIFESELRLDLIVSKLDTVIKQLEDIKNNQYTLYCEMKQMNQTLNSLKETTHSMMEAVKTMSTDISNIADNSAVIAHNTAVTAFYAKKNAELTDALGFMMALS